MHHSRPSDALSVDTLLPIVVGAHPRAEQADRPTAYRLRQAVMDWLGARFPQGAPPLVPLVISDVWYLNDQSLRERPAVSVGAPGVNAFTAYLGDKLPSAFCIDDRLIVQLDVEFGDMLAACWGSTPEGTARAAEAFTEKYLDGYLNAACSAPRAG